jgi:hypothetical protein
MFPSLNIDSSQVSLPSLAPPSALSLTTTLSLLRSPALPPLVPHALPTALPTLLFGPALPSAQTGKLLLSFPPLLTPLSAPAWLPL